MSINEIHSFLEFELTEKSFKLNDLSVSGFLSDKFITFIKNSEFIPNFLYKFNLKTKNFEYYTKSSFKFIKKNLDFYKKKFKNIFYVLHLIFYPENIDFNSSKNKLITTPSFIIDLWLFFLVEKITFDNLQKYYIIPIITYLFKNKLLLNNLFLNKQILQKSIFKLKILNNPSATKGLTSYLTITSEININSIKYT